MNQYADATRSGRYRALRLPAWGAVGVAVFLLQLNLGTPPKAIGLDSSWSAVLGWATAHHLVWGRDLVFTFGPLGFLYPGATYIRETFVAYVAAQIILGIVVCFGLLHAARERSPATRAALAAMFFVWWLPWGHPDSLWFLFFLCSHVALLAMARREGDPRLLMPAVLTYTIVVALSALMKFSMLPLSLAWAVATALALFRNGRRRHAAVLAVAYGATTAAGWLAARQPLGSIADYLRGAAEMSAGYGQAMSLVPSRAADVVGLSTLVATGITLFVFALRGRRSLTVLASLAFISMTVIIAWRSGYTRADGHMVIFYPIAFSALLFAPGIAGRSSRWWIPLLSIAIAATSLAAFPLFKSTGAGGLLADRFAEVMPRIRGLVHPDRLWSQREAERGEAIRLNRIPGIRAKVGDRPIDVFSWEQGMLLIHDMNYRPRPVFQGYAAYTEGLAELNQRFLAGPRAPDFAMLRIQAIDGRLPMADDPLALVSLMTRYMPVREENGFILLERQSVAPLPSRAKVTRTVRMNEWTQVPALQGDKSLQLLHVDVSPSVRGRLYALALRGAPLALDTQTTEGRVETWRIVPDVARAGFIVSPVLRDNNDFLDWYGEDSQARSLRRIRVRPMRASQHRLFEENMLITFEEQPIFPQPVDSVDPSLSLSGSASIRPAPVRRAGVVERLMEEGNPSLFMHAPAELVFAVEPGQHEVSATFGIRSDALASSGCEEADGVLFWVGYVDGTELYSRYINPFAKASDRGPQRVQGVSFTTDHPAKIAVRMLPGKPGANTACDWGYVRDLRITEPAADVGRAAPRPARQRAVAPTIESNLSREPQKASGS